MNKSMNFYVNNLLIKRVLITNILCINNYKDNEITR